jgi:hypothetical protein
MKSFMTALLLTLRACSPLPLLDLFLKQHGQHGQSESVKLLANLEVARVRALRVDYKGLCRPCSKSTYRPIRPDVRRLQGGQHGNMPGLRNLLLPVTKDRLGVPLPVFASDVQKVGGTLAVPIRTRAHCRHKQ